jgi:hypothetical protein
MAAGYKMVDKNVPPTDVTFKINIRKAYTTYDAGNNLNNNRPMYSFDAASIAPKVSDEIGRKNLDLVNVVPNPYRGYSEYENSPIDSRVKITNLPPECTITIFDMAGNLIRRVNKADNNTFFEWDLKNGSNVPIASGLYLIHIKTKDLGEKVVRWYGIMHAIDLAGLLTLGAVGAAVAGNPERQGQAGAAQLTINGWARSSGMGWANGGKVSGTEAMYMNVAGLDRIKNTTEMSFSRTEWLMGSGIAINNAGFAQKVGESGTFGISVMQYSIKPIEITTEQNPYGGIGTFRVNMTNIGLAYSKSFSSNISAGIMARMVSEGIPDAQASGVSLDAGVQYVTTLRPVRGSMKKDDFRFGISMKNIGPDMQHSGDGLSYKAILDNGTFSKTVQVKVDNIKLPALLNIAASYDVKLDADPNQYDNKLTLGFGFTNFAFSANQLTLAAKKAS